MKRILVITLSIALLFAMANGASATSLSLVPTDNVAGPGDSISLELYINDLGNFTAPSLGDFDINIAFDSSALSFTGYTLGSYLGDTSLGEALDRSSGDLGGGIVNVREVSLLDTDPTSGPGFTGPYLDDIQPGSFVLATMDFYVDVLALGDS